MDHRECRKNLGEIVKIWKEGIYTGIRGELEKKGNKWGEGNEGKIGNVGCPGNTVNWNTTG